MTSNDDLPMAATGKDKEPTAQKAEVPKAQSEKTAVSLDELMNIDDNSISNLLNGVSLPQDKEPEGSTSDDESLSDDEKLRRLLM